MATKKNTRKKTVQNKKRPNNLRRYFALRGLRSATPLLLFVVLMAGVGAYLHFGGSAQGKPPMDVPGRGLIYNGVGPEEHGPCAGEYETDSDLPGHQACTHQDPGPEGVDVRERADKVDKILSDEASYDDQHPQAQESPDPQDAAPTGVVSPEDTLLTGSLSDVTGVSWPCHGSGVDGYRVKFIYAYPAGHTNRLDSLRSGFSAVARRMNAIAYYSAQESGGWRMLNFATNPSCGLYITAVPITGDINNYDNIKHDIRASITTYSTRKYVVEVDGGTKCGNGDLFPDDRGSQDNYNNGSGGDMYAVIWKPCWSYGEPHELMHTLGGVQPSAPYATAGYHCDDEYDVMCYQDNSGSAMHILCTAHYKIWRYDCNFNTYFNAGTPTGWLSTHWNTANSRWFYVK